MPGNPIGSEHRSAGGDTVPPVTAALADFIVGSRFEDLPSDVRAEAARTLVNWAGGCVGGAAHEALEAIRRAVGPFSGPPVAAVLGRAGRTDPLTAALLNGASAAVLDFDDTHLRTVIHPASPIAPAVLALAQHMPATGAAFLHALVVGIEIACKLGNGISPDHYRHGWHITGTCGVIGSAAACAKLLGLDRRKTRWALSAAATQAAGLRAMFGGMARILHAGRAAQNGLAAALFAREGLTASDTGLEAEAGFAKVLSPRQDWTEMTDGLGERWETLQNTYKPFATGIVAHPAIDGCIRLRRAHGLTADRIGRIELAVNPIALMLTDNPSPATALEARLSIQHVCAAGLVHGAAGVAELTDESVVRPATVALRRLVEARPDDSLGRSQARVRIALRGGGTLETFVEHAYGSIENPMTDADLDAKVHTLADPVLGRERTGRLIALCRGVAELGAAASIAEAARAEGPD